MNLNRLRDCERYLNRVTKDIRVRWVTKYQVFDNGTYFQLYLYAIINDRERPLLMMPGRTKKIARDRFIEALIRDKDTVVNLARKLHTRQ